jgi:hypothetical protein
VDVCLVEAADQPVSHTRILSAAARLLWRDLQHAEEDLLDAEANFFLAEQDLAGAEYAVV